MRNGYPQHNVQRYTILILLLCLQIRVSQAQVSFVPMVVGSSISQSINNEIDGGILALGLNFVKARRTYELAVIIDEEEGVTGAEFVHKIFLNKKNATGDYYIGNYLFRPYLVYNLVYLREISSTQKDNNLIINGSDLYSAADLEEPEKVTLIQHYLGVGLEQDIFEHLFVTASAFTGIHLGENNNNNKIDPAKKTRQENAYSWNVKFGFGYRF